MSKKSMSNDSKEILFVCGAAYVSGKEVVSLALAERLLSRGYDVKFLVSRWNNGDFISRLRKARLPFRILSLGFISKSFDRRTMLMTADQLIRFPALLWLYFRMVRAEPSFRIIHTNWHHALLLAPLLRARRDVFWLHEVLPPLRHYGVIFRAIARRVQKIITVSGAARDALLALGVDPEKVHVVHNGLDLGSAVGAVGADGRRGAADISVGIVGQVAPWKGHEDLIEAIAILPSTINLRLHVFGEGDATFVAALRKLCMERKIFDRVEWHGFVAERSEIYRRIDICVVPTRSAEPLTTTAIEAGFYAIPVIGSNCGGTTEIIACGHSGLIVPPNDAQRLADAIKILSENPALRQLLGKNARDKMMREFSIDGFVDEFLEAISGAAEGVRNA
jgi:glycosyltransferase involved in cell wall biosynthesis